MPRMTPRQRRLAALDDPWADELAQSERLELPPLTQAQVGAILAAEATRQAHRRGIARGVAPTPERATPPPAAHPPLSPEAANTLPRHTPQERERIDRENKALGRVPQPKPTWDDIALNHLVGARARHGTGFCACGTCPGDPFRENERIIRTRRGWVIASHHARTHE